jgi:transposase-like protein
MRSARPPLFRKRQFEPTIIVTCVRWYCRFSLSLRDLEELMAERGLAVDHTTIWRWVQRYGPEVHRRLRGNVKQKSSTWHMDETFVRIAGRWLYLFRAVDSHGQTVDFYLSETRDREAAKHFLKKALANPDNRPPHVFARDGLRSYPAAIRELQKEGLMPQRCRHRTRPYANNRIESDHRFIKRRLRAMQGPRSAPTARRVIQAIEAVHMIRKGQALGITRHNLAGQAWVFAALLGVR